MKSRREGEEEFVSRIEKSEGELRRWLVRGRKLWHIGKGNAGHTQRRSCKQPPANSLSAAQSRRARHPQAHCSRVARGRPVTAMLWRDDWHGAQRAHKERALPPRAEPLVPFGPSRPESAAVRKASALPSGRGGQLCGRCRGPEISGRRSRKLEPPFPTRLAQPADSTESSPMQTPHGASLTTCAAAVLCDAGRGLSRRCHRNGLAVLSSVDRLVWSVALERGRICATRLVPTR